MSPRAQTDAEAALKISLAEAERDKARALSELSTAKESFFEQLALTEQARKEFQAHRELTRKEAAEARAALEQTEGHVLLGEQTIDALTLQLARGREEIDNLKKLHPEMALLSTQVRRAPPRLSLPPSLSLLLSHFPAVH